MIENKMAASTMATKPVPETQSRLECSVCLKRLQDPRELDCQHRLCLRCLQALAQSQDVGSKTLTCPVCSCETIVDNLADLLDKTNLNVHTHAKTWRLKSEVKVVGESQKVQFAFDVNAFSDGDIVVADIGHGFLIALSSKIESGTSEELEIKGLVDPSHVEVNQKDEIIVLDRPVVQFFDREFQFLRQLDPGPEVKVTSLAVDESNRIAAGCDTEEILLFNEDGFHAKTLPAPMLNDYLAARNRRLIYTNYRKELLVGVDYDGKMLFSVPIQSSMTGNWGPKGVCCDIDGNIFVGCCGWQSWGEIQHYSPEGQFLGCVVKGCGPAHGIALTPDGDLVVAAVKSVKVYCHK
ncbi:uncharacterized protein LOC119720494 [Patiria miniata]|uniref:RING-type domain-containing protein n=1 Tax=Patiria miniata TaxID=46514 RepID=A0A913Z515_PATMI|nr:uncharacterized protein LOC119720494 [Patiria miniata]